MRIFGVISFISCLIMFLTLALADNSTITADVNSYISLTLSEGYQNNVTFGSLNHNTTNEAIGNGDGNITHSDYYVTFVGNTLGNITFSCVNFTSNENILSKSNFMMAYSESPFYASIDYENATNFTEDIQLINLVPNTTIYSNYFIYVPYLQPAGNYKTTLSIIAETI